MSLDFLTEHQIHILQRIAAASGVFLLVLLFLTFHGKRHRRLRALQKDSNAGKGAGQVKILPARGWRHPAKRRKARR